jgi:uncharacterized phage infection (PIP) family protein YhgE
VNPQSNPNERFDQVEPTLEQLSNSFSHLLTAQVLMNDWQQRSEKLIEQLAEQAMETNRRLDRLIEKVDTLADGQKRIDLKIEALVDGQKHNDSNIEALTEIVRQLIERNGNGRSNH